MSLNHITIMGRLCADPVYRTTGSGISVANFSVAVDRDFSGKDGGEKETDFIDCTAWRKTAEFVTKYFTKGRMIVVSGRLQINSYTDKDGNKRRNAVVVADNCYFGDSKRDEGSSNNSGYSGNSSGYSNQGNSYGNNGGYSGGAYDDTLAYAQKLGGQRPDYQYPYPGPPQQADDFAMLDDDGPLPF
jgi:single-strand DNA-binding protein